MPPDSNNETLLSDRMYLIKFLVEKLLSVFSDLKLRCSGDTFFHENFVTYR
jgi:hypothetical protein